MNNSLKKELSFITGLLALGTSRTHSPLLKTTLTLSSLGLMLASMKQVYNFRGKNIYVTGGSRGLGLSLSWHFLKRGANLTLVARDEAELQRARRILLSYYPLAKIHLSVCDITDSQALRQSLSEAKTVMNGIDVLVNNAGSILVGGLGSMTRDDFDAQINLHVYAVIEATQWIRSHFKARGGGRIVNICSLGGKVAVPHMIPYDTSKFALAGFSQGAGAELAQENIHITTVYPTVMRTGSPIQAVFKGDHEREYLWFATADNLPLLSISADLAAQKILDAVENGRTEVILSLPAKVRVWFGTFFPETANALMSLVARMLPRKESLVRKTGADSGRLFDKTPLRVEARENEMFYNQMPHHDGEYNMGLKH